MKFKVNSLFLQPTPIPTPSTVEQQEQLRETTPTSHTAAFQPPPVSTVQQHDVTMGTPDSSLLATPLQKPVPVRYLFVYYILLKDNVPSSSGLRPHPLVPHHRHPSQYHQLEIRPLPSGSPHLRGFLVLVHWLALPSGKGT